MDLRVGHELKVVWWDAAARQKAQQRFNAGLPSPDSWHAPTILVHDLERLGPRWLYPGEGALLHTAEVVKIPRDKAGLVLLKSSRGREFFQHSFSGFADPGFEGQLTLEVYAPTIPIKLEYGLKIVQLILFDCESPIIAYGETGSNSNYQGQMGATESVWATRGGKGA